MEYINKYARGKSRRTDSLAKGHRCELVKTFGYNVTVEIIRLDKSANNGQFYVVFVSLRVRKCYIARMENRQM